jgi:hypothetical protein
MRGLFQEIEGSAVLSEDSSLEANPLAGVADLPPDLLITSRQHFDWLLPWAA